MGHKVIFGRDSQECFDAFETHRGAIDAVLLDINISSSQTPQPHSNPNPSLLTVLPSTPHIPHIVPGHVMGVT
jgi:hypothetical protein